MGVRARIAGFAAAGLLVVAPIVMTAQPAAAATHHAEKTGSVTFIDVGGFQVTCTVDLITDLDTTAKTLTATADLSESSGTGSECFHAIGELVVDYTDTHGYTRHFEADYTDGGGLKATDVASNVKVTATANIQHCDPGLNGTCTATVVAAPK